MHDFLDKDKGKVTPDGVFDIAANSGWVAVGIDHDTAAFAVHTIATWWDKAGRNAYPDAQRLLITADGGGTNGYRTRLWKTELARFAAETGLEVTVCHRPPGTSKWNKIEHGLFSQISLAWRGRPLTSHEVIVEPLAATTTRTGLTVTAELDTGQYRKGIKIGDKQMDDLDEAEPSTAAPSTASGITPSSRTCNWAECLRSANGGYPRAYHVVSIPYGMGHQRQDGVRGSRIYGPRGTKNARSCRCADGSRPIGISHLGGPWPG